MSERNILTAQEDEEVLGRIETIQREIYELDEEISEQVDTLMSESKANPPEALNEFLSAMQEGTHVHETVQHLLKIKEDWDLLYTRICAFNENDEELLEGLIPLLGELLLEQPSGIEERWIQNLEEFLDRQKTNIN